MGDGMKAGEKFNPRNTFLGVFIPEALAASTVISSTGKLAYGHLVRRAGDNGRCWPSARDVAKYIGVRERAAQRALKELQRGDPPLIRATFRTDEHGRQTSNEFCFIWGPILEGVKNDSPVKNDTLPPVKNDRDGGVKNDTRKVKEEKCQKENVKSILDSCPASQQKTVAKTSQPVPRFDAGEAKQLSAAIGAHFGVKIETPSPLWPTGYQEPPASIVDQCLKSLGRDLVSPFCEFLTRLPAENQRGGRKAPRDFPWYVVTAKNFAFEPTLQKPTLEVCRHGRHYDVCSICLPPETFARMSECF